jgi:MerR family redox-sensitive transcriptional activator SoxR
MSATWRTGLDARITELEQVRDNLASCVGCGCLSMRQCALYNTQDTLADTGAGARRLLPGTR